MKAKAPIVFAAGLLAAVVIVAGITSSDQSDGESTTISAHHSRALAVWKTKPVAVLHRKPRPSDRPSTIEVPDLFLESYGIDVGATRRATVVNGFPLFVAPGTKGLCLLDAASAVTDCWATKLVLNGDAMVSSLCSYRRQPGAVTVAGVIPDGIRKVVVHRGRLGNSSATVKNNVFVAILDAGNPLPFTISWSDLGKTEFHSSGIPAGTRYVRCSPVR